MTAALLIDQKWAVLLQVCSALQLPALGPQLRFCCRQFLLCVQVASVCDTFCSLGSCHGCLPPPLPCSSMQGPPMAPRATWECMCIDGDRPQHKSHVTALVAETGGSVHQSSPTCPKCHLQNQQHISWGAIEPQNHSGWKAL